MGDVSPSRGAADGGQASAEGALRLDMETLVGYILLVGVLVSMALLLAGLVWHWAMAGSLQLQFTITGMNVFQFVRTDVGQAVSGTWRPGLLIKLGIAALLLTPYVRVLVAMCYFAMVDRNWKYTVFTGIVFSVLTYSLFLR